jgi:RNA dependent RNA polymerase
MVSLDPKLPEKAICIRPSMIKFESKGATHVEVCGIADRKIPLYLNRPLINILEDLGIGVQVFLDLQAAMLSELELTVDNATNASKFLTTERVANACGIPDLLVLLDQINMDAQDDPFIRSVVEIAVLCHLRDAKYRGRIPVTKGVKLYGVMDETGLLKEGQIYCSWVEHDKQVILEQQDVLVTRSPTMHPGDVQVVQAVKPPPASPLHHLYNCVVFSQFGSRDLPSQLGGGGKTHMAPCN